MEKKSQKLFVLVHGLCHGAWTWYKVKPHLEAAGHILVVRIGFRLEDDLQLMSTVPQEEWLDTVFGSYENPDRPLQTVLFGPKFMAKKVYQLSPVEDLELAKMLVRVNPVVTDNLAGTRSFTEEGYGSVTRIYYILCGEDNLVPEEYQRWMIRNFPPREVTEIKDADHMAMNSKPHELCARLLEIADKYT